MDSVKRPMAIVNLEVALIESYLSMEFGKRTVGSKQLYLICFSISFVQGGLIHYATWESAVYGFSRAHELKSLRRQLFPEKLPFSKYRINR